MASSYTLQDLADELGANVQGDSAYLIHSLATLQSAGAGQLAFVANAKYQKYLKGTLAGAVIISPAEVGLFSGNAIVTENPYLAYAQLSQKFSAPQLSYVGISPTASVADDIQLNGEVTISPGACIARGVVLEDSVFIGPNVVIGENCHIGRGTVLNANVTLYADTHLGESCIVHSGAVLGADGFGYANDKGEWVKIAQLGGVRIGDQVEIGACTTVDRGALEHTVIHSGVILDNQIQIAHNVEIGENTAIAGCTAVAGSTKIGQRCTIAGACGITGHLEIADDVHVTAMTLVTKSIKDPGAYSSGTGFMPYRPWKKNVVRFRQLDELARRLKSVENRIDEIKGSEKT